MSINIAVAGKGGTGKTSITCLVIRYLLKHGSGPILAVDADPNANLGDSLGLKVKQTMGSIIASFNDLCGTRDARACGRARSPYCPANVGFI